MGWAISGPDTNYTMYPAWRMAARATLSSACARRLTPAHDRGPVCDPWPFWIQDYIKAVVGNGAELPNSLTHFWRMFRVPVLKA